MQRWKGALRRLGGSGGVAVVVVEVEVVVVVGGDVLGVGLGESFTGEVVGESEAVGELAVVADPEAEPLSRTPSSSHPAARPLNRAK